MRCPNCEEEVFLQKSVSETQSRETFNRTSEEIPRRQVTQCTEPFPCPNCPAMIKTNDRFLKLTSYRFGGLAWTLFCGLCSTYYIISAVSAVGVKSLYSWLFTGVFLILVGFGASAIVITSVLLRRVNRWEVDWMRRTCRHCGDVVVLKDAKFCPTCGTGLPAAIVTAIISKDLLSTQKPPRKAPKVEPVGTCLVCDLEMNPADVLAGCPHCGNVFHKTHLVRWVRMKKRCPACAEPLLESGIITPFTEGSTETGCQEWTVSRVEE